MQPAAPAPESRSSRPTALFLCVHKGASSFIAKSFAAAMEQVLTTTDIVNVGNQVDEGSKTYADLPVPRTGANFVRVYPKEYHALIEADPVDGERYAGTRLVVVRRDPRDVAVSLYFARAVSHTPPAGSQERFLETRKSLLEIGPRTGVRRVAKGAMREFHEQNEIIAARPDALLTTYAELVTDYRGWIDRVGEFLDWTLDERQQIFNLTRNAFDLPLLVDPKQHVRRITPGNWLEYDNPRLRERFEELGGDALREWGYEWPDAGVVR